MDGEAALRYVAQDAPSGYGDAADRLVRALRASGVRVEYRGWRGLIEDADPPGLRPFSRDPLPDERAQPGAPTVAHLVPEHYVHVLDATADLPGGVGPLIAHTVWETDRLPKHWPPLFDQVQRVIVPTEWNRATFVSSGVTTPVVVVPHVVCDPVPGDGGVPLGLPADVVVFYTISRWDQRKDPAAVINAFLDAFTADDPVALVVKTTPLPQFPVMGKWGRESTLLGTTMLEVARLVRAHPRPPLVQVEIEDWSPARIAGLHSRGDCFVSLSHAEGWNVGAFDAAAHGNPVVLTGWGGPLAWLDSSTAYLVEHDVVPVQHFEAQSYSPDQHWAEPRREHAVELMREVARDLGAARRRAASLRAQVLHDYAGPRVVATLRAVVPELGSEPARTRSSTTAQRETIPRIAHFVFGLRAEREPFHVVHYLAIKSCLDVVQPDEVHLHCHDLPSGPAWDRVEPYVRVHRIEPVSTVGRFRYPDPHVGRYRYAHHADFARLDVLAVHGGLYADLDTLFVAPIPDELWHQPFVIGREADVSDNALPIPRSALSNALLMSTPSSQFLAAWRAEIDGAFDGSWARHSCFLAHDLACRMPSDVHVEPQQTFHAFEPTIAGIALLLEHPPPDLEGIVSLHLAAHLWWDEDRVNFSHVHADAIDEAWIRNSPSTYAVCARRFLPCESWTEP